eukprot:CAMPEP_0170500346 /NCGR_PEP_ID=MMETSP0208-20121228/34516_1 /TAXON_ID=197538 /ORGANISM="Strombidium inclinatum, Strain S3" /LENGTH=39 /DNA_ID= /DNA_START= /DNA_END= /DNA_ORIENTATION=
MRANKSQFYYYRGTSNGRKSEGLDAKKEQFKKNMWAKME